MFVAYDDKDLSDSNLKLKFHTKFLAFIFSVGLSIVFFVAYLSLKGLKSDFDNSFPESLNEINLLNEFQTQYMLETINILQNPVSINPRTKSLYLWELYSNHIHLAQRQNIFMFLRELYQNLFLTYEVAKIKQLNAQKQQLIEYLDYIIMRGSPEAQNTQNSLLQHSRIINEMSSKIINTQVAIHVAEKKTTDTFHIVTVGMLSTVTFAVFGIVVSLSATILTFIQRFNIYLKKLFDNATRELSMLNSHLQEEINKQVKIMQEKDKLLYTQSKLASMGEMIQNIAHQWRQPLNSLILVIQSIKSKFERETLTPEIMKEQTKLAMKIAQNMSNTIDNFRSFFHLETKFEVFNIFNTINHAIVLNKPIFDSLDIRVNLECDKTMEFFGSKNMLIQVLLVLLSNSKDALSEQRITRPQCFIKVEKEEEYIVIHYYDNGGGIHDNVLDKIFEPYFTTKHKSLGTGVGLYMARELLMNHFRGEILVDNYEFFIDKDYCKGALFVLKLQITQEILLREKSGEFGIS
ncbi:ATP-binding protein [Helicobacter didelphidarum]|uniref:histidine kinase n=1 Tax=Helicobacter didelphidarum TaxID=2040648 RepID=A0A3D8ILL7_9HELI|nr:HAMP domain-containing sensor histidine kinase [Helicobacter didelphidarum]RDU65900.1 ATP-binding protein [Helicobacter didelphidarum]